MTKASRNKIYLPRQDIATPKNDNQSEAYGIDRELFYKKTQVEKYHLINASDSLYLTKMQAQCATYLIAGATAKQSARALNLSYRTVESYLNDIKNKIFEKTGENFKKDQFVRFLKNSFLDGAVFPQSIIY